MAEWNWVKLESFEAFEIELKKSHTPEWVIEKVREANSDFIKKKMENGNNDLENKVVEALKKESD
jgi:hypothetical protein